MATMDASERGDKSSSPTGVRRSTGGSDASGAGHGALPICFEQKKRSGICRDIPGSISLATPREQSADHPRRSCDPRYTETIRDRSHVARPASRAASTKARCPGCCPLARAGSSGRLQPCSWVKASRSGPKVFCQPGGAMLRLRAVSVAPDGGPRIVARDKTTGGAPAISRYIPDPFFCSRAAAPPEILPSRIC